MKWWFWLVKRGYVSLLWGVSNFLNGEAHLHPSRTSTMELFSRKKITIFTYSHSLTTGVTFLTDFFEGLTLLSNQAPQWLNSCSGYHVPCWTHSIPLHCLWQPLAQICCSILRDHRTRLALDRVYLFECFFSFKKASPSKVVDMTASPFAKKKKKNSKNGNAHTKMNGQKSIQYCVLLEIHMHMSLARRTLHVNIKD